MSRKNKNSMDKLELLKTIIQILAGIANIVCAIIKISKE